MTIKKLELREYQLEAVEACFESLRADNNTIISAATGAGKSIIITEILRRAKAHRRRVLVITHNQDLVKNNYETCKNFLGNKGYSVCCSGLGHNSCIGILAVFASVTTFKNKLSRKESVGDFDLIIIDECHRVNSESGQYKEILDILKVKKIIGLTATPWRQGTGELHKGDNAVFDNVCYSIGVKELVKSGYLTEVKSLGNNDLAKDVSGSFRSDGMIDNKESVAKIHNHVSSVVKDIIKHLSTFARRSVIVFVPEIVSIKEFVDEFNKVGGITALGIDGSHKTEQRQQAFDFLDFSNDLLDDGNIRIVVNVGVLTTGVSINRVDTIVFARSMESSSLMVQMAGRGMRLHKDKEYCLLLDYGRNIERLGFIDAPIVPEPRRAKGKARNDDIQAKVCDSCGALNNISARRCVECQHRFVEIEETAWNGQATEPPRIEYVSNGEVDLYYSKKDVDKLHPIVKVTYVFDSGGFISEYLCLEHKNDFAKRKARETIKEMLISKTDYKSMKEHGLINDSAAMVEFMQNNWEKYFKIPCAIELSKNKKNPKYYDISRKIWSDTIEEVVES